MAKKRFCLGILVIMLVIGMAVVGCDNGSTNVGGGGDEVEIPAQYHGKWSRTISSITTQFQYLEISAKAINTTIIDSVDGTWSRTYNVDSVELLEDGRHKIGLAAPHQYNDVGYTIFGISGVDLELESVDVFSYLAPGKYPIHLESDADGDGNDDVNDDVNGDGDVVTEIIYTVEARDTPTERILFFFQSEVIDLDVTDITIANGTGSLTVVYLGNVYKSPTQWRYELFVIGTKSGTVSIKVTKDGIETGEKEVIVQKGLDDDLVLDDGWAWVGGGGDGGYIFKPNAAYQRIVKSGSNWSVYETGLWKAYNGQFTLDPGPSSGSTSYSVTGNTLNWGGGYTKTNIGAID